MVEATNDHVEKIKGFLGLVGDLVYFTDGRNVFRGPKSNSVDVTTGYMHGRWECSVEHWNRYCGSIYGMPDKKI